MPVDKVWDLKDLLVRQHLREAMFVDRSHHVHKRREREPWEREQREREERERVRPGKTQRSPREMTEAVTRSWLDAGCPSPLAVNAKDGSLLVYVPAGEFEMGDGRDRDCPQHTVSLSSYWISVFCVTNGQYARFLRESGRAVNEREQQRPSSSCEISYEDAVAYTLWAGCQLPTEAQWEKAATGPAGLVYPWGKDWDSQKATGRNNPRGASGYGTFSQSGDVSEWSLDWYEASYYRQSPRRDPRGPDVGSTRTCRGGRLIGTEGYPRSARRDKRAPGQGVSIAGFRLVKPGF